MKQHLRQVGRIGSHGIAFGADDRRRRFEQKQRAGKHVRAAAKAAIVVESPERLGFSLRRQIQAYHSALPRTRKVPAEQRFRIREGKTKKLMRLRDAGN